MIAVITSAVLLLALLGLGFMSLQVALLSRHLRKADPSPEREPGISVLKPLCGLDDELRRNLESFAHLDYPTYEVLLGIEDVSDSAYPLACQAAARWPDRMRVVLQRGNPGLNPKVNQLITLGQVARHEILVISDSNVAAAPEYLRGIAGHLSDPQVGLVTHPVMGIGEVTLGSLMDNAHLSSGIAPGMVVAAKFADFPIVVGKSMALRRDDLNALGGFASVKDVLAEDFVLGQRVGAELGKTVAVAHQPITAVSSARTLRRFFARYARWATIQRKSVDSAKYGGMLLLSPWPLSALALLLSPCDATRAACALCWAWKALLDEGAGRALRGSGFGLRGALSLPLRESLLHAAWLAGLVVDRVTWRGHRLAVLSGTRLAPVDEGRFARLLGPPRAALSHAVRRLRPSP